MATQEAKEILLVKLGNRIKTIRKSRNLSQKAMAEKCGMDFASYSNIENGKRNVTVFTLQRIIRVLKLSFNETKSYSIAIYISFSHSISSKINCIRSLI